MEIFVTVWKFTDCIVVVWYVSQKLNYFWNCMGNLSFSFAVTTGCETLHFALTT